MARARATQNLPEFLKANASASGPSLIERMTDELDRSYRGLLKARKQYKQQAGDRTQLLLAKLEGRVSGIVHCIATLKNPYNMEHSKEQVIKDMKFRYELERDAKGSK